MLSKSTFAVLRALYELEQADAARCDATLQASPRSAASQTVTESAAPQTPPRSAAQQAASKESAQSQPLTQRVLAEYCGYSLGTVNAAVRTLTEDGLAKGCALTDAGRKTLESYRVDNAIIMAAGLSTRFAPISYEKPKGVLVVRGEKLIERQISQLQSAGINDITVVVGYKKEFFFYLQELFGVNIVTNNEYATRNNHASLMAAIDQLGSTYICSSDNYFTENPFHRYEYHAYYAAEYAESATGEWCMDIGPQDRITGVRIGGAEAWYMIGHAYFDRAFSAAFARILREEYDRPSTIDKLWEALFVEHIAELDMHIMKYPSGTIQEFDSLYELKQFDPYFLENVDSVAFDHITEVLGCAKDDICDIYPLKQGLTNLSCHFRVGDGEYVYRHPGVGTEKLVNRRAEAEALAVAREIGVDRTFITADPETGWKISYFIPDCIPFDPHNPAHAKRAMELARDLHSQSKAVSRSFNFFDEGMRYDALLREKGPIEVPGYEDMLADIRRLEDYVIQDGGTPCLCHNDFFELNLLIDQQDNMSLIDWEYAGMSDYANDFGTYTTCCQLSEEEALFALEAYFERTPTEAEIAHNFAHVALAGWCWYVWSLYKEAEGECVGEWLYIYYRYGVDYLKKALERYGCLERPSVAAAMEVAR